MATQPFTGFFGGGTTLQPQTPQQTTAFRQQAFGNNQPFSGFGGGTAPVSSSLPTPKITYDASGYPMPGVNQYTYTGNPAASAAANATYNQFMQQKYSPGGAGYHANLSAPVNPTPVVNNPTQNPSVMGNLNQNLYGTNYTGFGGSSLSATGNPVYSGGGGGATQGSAGSTTNPNNLPNYYASTSGINLRPISGNLGIYQGPANSNGFNTSPLINGRSIMPTLNSTLASPVVATRTFGGSPTTVVRS